MNIQIIEGTGTDNLLLLSGVHGNEYTPIVALYELFFDEKFITKAKKQYKSITFIHAVNEYGMKNNVRGYEANADLNRIFRPDIIKDELLRHIEAADYIFDIHSSPNCIDFVLINDGDLTYSMVEYCKSIDIPYAVWDGSNDTIKSHALRQGKIAFTIECNGIGTVDVKSGLNTYKILKKMVLTKYKKPNIIEYKKVPMLETSYAQFKGILTWITPTVYSILNPENGNIHKFQIPDNVFIINRNKDAYVTTDDYTYQYQYLEG